MYCPDCGRKYNDPEMHFCPYCTIPLKSGRPSPWSRFKAPLKKSRRAPHQPTQTVFIPASRHPTRIRNTYILVLLLLLLIACCCGLLLTERMEVPGFVAPYVEPYLTDMREAFRGFIDLPLLVVEDKEDKCGDIKCEDFQKILMGEVFDWKAEINCDFNEDCELIMTRMTGLDADIFDCVEIHYGWIEKDEDGLGLKEAGKAKPADGGILKEADCAGHPTDYRCKLDFEPDKCVIFYFGLGGCDPFVPERNFTRTCELGGKRGGKNLVQRFNLTGPTASSCCSDPDFRSVYYDNGRLYLDVICDEPFANQCFEGVVYDGLDNFWTNVSCCSDPGDPDRLKCEGLDYITAKTVKARMDLEYEGTYGGTCSIDDYFPLPDLAAPPETPEEEQTSPCDSGEILCGGVCCDPSYCSDGECYE